MDDHGKDFAGKTLFDVMSDQQTFGSTKTKHWIGAWLNGLSGGAPGFTAPYNASEIMAFYISTDTTLRDKAYALIVTYLETHS